VFLYNCYKKVYCKKTDFAYFFLFIDNIIVGSMAERVKAPFLWRQFDHDSVSLITIGGK